MQRMMLESEMRDVAFQAVGARAVRRLAPRVTTDLERGAPELKTFLHDMPAVDLAYKRPKKDLPAGFASFDEQAALDATFAIGQVDGEAPFTAYEWEHFRV